MTLNKNLPPKGAKLEINTLSLIHTILKELSKIKMENTHSIMKASKSENLQTAFHLKTSIKALKITINQKTLQR
jgi:hypothetical protein